MANVVESTTTASSTRVDALVERAFHTSSRLRQARTFHPKGFVLRGRVEVEPAGSFLASAGSGEVLARVSRGVGLPAPAPDFNGIALRIIDAHGPGDDQDLLLVSASGHRVLRHVLRPARSWDRPFFTSVIPFEANRGIVMLGGRVEVGRPGPIDLDSLVRATREEGVRITLSSAPPLGRWDPIAAVSLTEVDDGDPPDLAFDPWNTGPDLRPWGRLNQLRLPAFRGSRAGRSRPR